MMPSNEGYLACFVPAVLIYGTIIPQI